MCKNLYDLFVIGGGVNGTAIARDAVGRGLSVALTEKDDLAAATSSASTKLFHGGLRYLEYFHLSLVRESLVERSILLENMPHIAYPMRFVIPYSPDMRFDSSTPISKLLKWCMPWLRGRRPAWLIRLGLFIYDHLGDRGILPPTTSLDLRCAPEGEPLQNHFCKAYEYSDCWVQDARLVILMACDARDRGATIMTRNSALRFECKDGIWQITTEKGMFHARVLVNATGAWVNDIMRCNIGMENTDNLRLVKGSHIVTRKLFDHEKCYFLQGDDGRIIFAIPYERDFTLLGTTDIPHSHADQLPECSPTEVEYLCRFASRYFTKPVTPEDVLWSYSGVRPLFDDGVSSATAVTREYILRLNDNVAPMLTVYGGKLTTHRKLAEDAMIKILPFFSDAGKAWTKKSPLPGGDFAVDARQSLIKQLQQNFSFLSEGFARRLIEGYGTRAWILLEGAQTLADLGQMFGADLSAREIDYLVKYEFATCMEDVVWRRSKLGLHLNDAQIADIASYMAECCSGLPVSSNV